MAYGTQLLLLSIQGGGIENSHEVTEYILKEWESCVPRAHRPPCENMRPAIHFAEVESMKGRVDAAHRVDAMGHERTQSVVEIGL
jgi:hypothetical protein